MCGNLAEGGAAERRARRESRLTARNTARAAATATECTVKARCERVAQVALDCWCSAGACPWVVVEAAASLG